MKKTTVLNKPAASPVDTAADALIDGFLRHLRLTQAQAWDAASPHDFFVSLARAVRDQIVDRLIATQRVYHEQDVKRVYYLSLEYMLGRLLRNNLVCLGLYEPARQRLARLGLDIEELCEFEPDAGLGNGGLGRLAACYLDSACTLELPLYGYGLRYEFGIFEQAIIDGWQVERPDYWLRLGSPWEVARPEYACPVQLYGRVVDQNPRRQSWAAEGTTARPEGRASPREGEAPAEPAQQELRPPGRASSWEGYRTVIGLPYDIPVIGHGVNTVNLLRLWSARASESFDLAAFNRGGYVEAVREKALSETITKVLYPSDETDAGRELRLVQEYLFVACTLSDIIRRYEKTHDDFDAFPDKVAVQLNDTHPALAIAALMRIFVDERGLDWDRAWELTRATFAYTNHTLLPEALEQWPAALLGRVLPRHLQIIYGINERFLDGEVERRWPGDGPKRERLSLVQEYPTKAIRMAHLAIVGSRRVNGVAALHSDLLRRRLVPDFAELWPEKFVSITNGVTPRRWLLSCNPGLAEVITRRIGDGWIRNLDQLRRLEAFADDYGFQTEIQAVKYRNKQRLAEHVQKKMGLRVSPDAMFDVQVKRLHEYKRQLLNALHVIVRYQRLLDGGGADVCGTGINVCGTGILPVQRVVIFGAKAAPAYTRAKLIIKFINEIARKINTDPRVGDRLRVVFLPNYGVSLAERIVPAADLSEQISTAGTEASGTGNMKFALNGALTIGTLDGANVEIRQAVGEENFFLFGLTAEEVAAQRPHHAPERVYHGSAPIRRAVDAVADGQFSPHDPGLFRPIFDSLLRDRDYYMLMADLPSYLDAQDRVDALWRKPQDWARTVILNIARMGYFSSDRAVGEYAEQIWGVARTPIGSRAIECVDGE